MARVTTAMLLAEIAALRAQINAAPAHGKAESRTFTRSHACKVDPTNCVRLTRTAARSLVHGTDAGGHAPQTAAQRDAK